MPNLYQIDISVNYNRTFYIAAENQEEAENIIKIYHQPDIKSLKLYFEYNIKRIHEPGCNYFDKVKNIVPIICESCINEIGGITKTIGQILQEGGTGNSYIEKYRIEDS